MLLVIDAGNTHVSIGAYESDKLLFVSRLATDRTMTEDQFAISINSIFKLNNVDPKDFTGAIISSVVPELTRSIKIGIMRVTGTEPLILEPGLKTGLNIKLDNPAELGADLCATAVGALASYELPCIIVDVGTATKVTVVASDGSFRGGIIAPGVLMSLGALANGTSQLSSIAIKSPKNAIGTNTADCIRGGIVYGTADLIDGAINRMVKELGEPAKSIVITGGFCSIVAKHCSHNMEIDKNLLMDGLKVIYEKNV